jgi:hypothetical protein
VGGRNGIHLPISAGPLTAEVTGVMANFTMKWNPDSRIFMKVSTDLFTKRVDKNYPHRVGGGVSVEKGCPLLKVVRPETRLEKAVSFRLISPQHPLQQLDMGYSLSRLSTSAT